MAGKLTTIIMDNTGFSVKYWGRYSLEAFINENLQNGVYKKKVIETRIQLLTIVHQLIQHELT